MAENALQLPAAPFRLVARIAHGGMATIYVGTRGVEQVAVKLLHPHLAEDTHIGGMFLHEAHLASRLEHPNVVHVMDHGEHPVHGTFIVMQYVEGGDLSTLIEAAAKAKTRLAVDVVLRIVIDLCQGLEAAHGLRAEDGTPLHLIHRDVSPHNLLVGTDGVARLTDFGIAKSDERYTLTSPGQLRGKLAYMAPEQLAHEDDLDQRVDVFAAGVLLFEALTGRRLFKADDEISTINKVLLERVPPPSDFRAELSALDAVVLKALAREREDRWPTARAFADALEEASGALGGPASHDAVRATVLDLLDDHLAKRASKIRAGSLTNSGIFASQAPGASSDSLMPAEPTYARRSPWLWPLVALLVLGAGGLGAAIAWTSREPAAETPASFEAAPPSVEHPADEASADEAEAEAAADEAAIADDTVAAVPEAALADPPRGTSVSPPSGTRRRSRPSAVTPSESPRPSARPSPGDDLYPNPFRD